MEDEKKTKKQMIEELNKLRQSVSELKGFAEEIQQTKINQEKFTKAFLNNSIPVGITTLKDGRYIEVSDAFLTLMGRTRDEVIGSTTIETGFITQEQRKSFFDELNKNGSVENFEMEVKTKGGALRHGLFNAVMMTLGKEKCLLTVMIDITERKQVLHDLHVHQDELAAQNEELRRAQVDLEALQSSYFDLYDLAPVGYVTISEKGRIQKTNLTAATMLGLPRQDLFEQPFSRFVLPADAGIYSRLSKLIFETNEPQMCELRMVKKDRTESWMRLDATKHDSDGAPAGLIVIGDITYRKRVEDELRKSEIRLSQAAEQSRSISWDVDADGLFTFVSPVSEAVWGYRPDELVNKKHFYDLHPAEGRDAFKKGGLEILRLREDFRNMVHPMQTKDGSLVWVSTSGITMLNKDRTLRGYRGSDIDITDRKRTEEEKEILEAQNRQLQKSESLGRMAGSIAHHFNNKLAAVIGNLELALMEMPKGANPQARIIAAMEASGKAAEISGMMLTYLGQSFEQRELLDLSDACVQALPMLQAVMPVNVFLEKDLPAPGPILSTNADYIQQVLSNLITNAWESIGTESGTVSLRVKTVSPAQISAVNLRPIGWQPQASAYACLEVADSGCGIKPNNIEQLFDPFFTDKFTGRGMGLPVVLGIVKTHNGALTVESEPKKGSTFRIFFPLSEETFMRSQKAGSSDDSSISASSTAKFEGGGTVLVVEDDEMLCNMVGTMLESFGFSVMKARDGVEALEIFGQHQSEVKFVLSDLTMPRMNGWETLTALRKLQPGIPVILASGYDKAHVMEGDHPELPQAFLAKPYNLKALSNAISQVLSSEKK